MVRIINDIWNAMIYYNVYKYIIHYHGQFILLGKLAKYIYVIFTKIVLTVAKYFFLLNYDNILVNLVFFSFFISVPNLVLTLINSQFSLGVL